MFVDDFLRTCNTQLHDDSVIIENNSWTTDYFEESNKSLPIPQYWEPWPGYIYAVIFLYMLNMKNLLDCIEIFWLKIREITYMIWKKHTYFVNCVMITARSVKGKYNI